jgi:NAD-dependent SIR2 family protein deacetylase
MFSKYDNILILSGAGFGIDAGLPDYQGMHRMVDEAAHNLGVEPYMIEHPDFYQQNPRGAWGMKARVMNIFLTKKPHAGYYKLKELLHNKNFFIITSNIDDHYREAGFDENRLYEIHGRLKLLQCVSRSCNLKHNLWKLDHLPQEENMVLQGPIPKCKFCNNYARPNVCFTDDASFCNKIRNAQKAKYNEWIKKVSHKRNPKLLILEIGCGRHKDSIGLQQLTNGTFQLLSRELKLPEIFTSENMKVIRVNPDRNIGVEKWEDVYYETGLNFFQKHF